jgi:hypothetical protein
VPRAEGTNARDNPGDRNLFPFRIPTGVRRIAPHTTEIATAGADEDRRHTREFAFALDREEEFGDFHEERGYTRLAAAATRRCVLIGNGPWPGRLTIRKI